MVWRTIVCQRTPVSVDDGASPEHGDWAVFADDDHRRAWIVEAVATAGGVPGTPEALDQVDGITAGQETDTELSQSAPGVKDGGTVELTRARAGGAPDGGRRGSVGVEAR